LGLVSAARTVASSTELEASERVVDAWQLGQHVVDAGASIKRVVETIELRQRRADECGVRRKLRQPG
jgi:hypothetical protein